MHSPEPGFDVFHFWPLEPEKQLNLTHEVNVITVEMYECITYNYNYTWMITESAIGLAIVNTNIG